MIQTDRQTEMMHVNYCRYETHHIEDVIYRMSYFIYRVLSLPFVSLPPYCPSIFSFFNIHGVFLDASVLRAIMCVYVPYPVWAKLPELNKLNWIGLDRDVLLKLLYIKFISY